MNDRCRLLVLPTGPNPNSEAILEAARTGGLDSHTLRIQLNGQALAAAARGSAQKLQPAALALSAAGLKAAVVTDAEVHALAPIQVAGGVSSDGDRLSLLVHGRPYGPPPGVPLLFVLADLGQGERALNPADQQPTGTVRQRLLRATLPVVDVVWKGGRVRVSMRGMTWRGLPRHSLSGADNLIQTLGTLAHEAAGTAVDFGFVGQDLALDPPRGTLEPIEGVNRERSHLFDRYAAAAALAWEKGLYPGARQGEVAPVAGGAVGADIREARAFFASIARPRAAPAIPWLRRGSPSRVRWSPWPWLVGPPLATFLLFLRLRSIETVGFLSGMAFAVGGLVSILVGLRALSLRERVRSVPLSKVRSMSMGSVGLAGKVIAIAPFKAPYSRAECVWYRFEVRTFTAEAGPAPLYRTIGEGTSGDVPFLLEDDTGSVLVQPANAEVDCDPETFALADGTGAVEWTIPVGARAFVSGFAQRRSTDSASEGPVVRADRDDVFVGSDPQAPLTIALRSRSEEVRSLSRRSTWPVVAGAAYLIVALILWLGV